MRRLQRLALVVCAGVVACTDPGQPPRRTPPVAEFLLSAGDSTWWVRSDANGLRVRSAPILLTQTEGRFYEVFVAEDAEEYVEASLASARIFARDVTARDSIQLYADPTVQREIARWKRSNPRAELLDEEEALDEDEPPTVIGDDIAIVDVHGPWVTFRHAIDIDIEGRTDHRHLRRRGVTDVRTGRRATLATLFGPASATRAIDAGRAALEAFKDSIMQLGDERAERARETLSSFVFDPNSFGLTDIARMPAVAFMVPGHDADGSAIALNLPAVRVDEQPWWAEVRPTLPDWSADSASLQWARTRYLVRATPTADGGALAVTVENPRDTTGGAPRAWFVANVPTPAYQLVSLDDPSLTRELRGALMRAFDAASALDGLGQQVAWQRPRRPSTRRGAVPIVTPVHRMRTARTAERHAGR